MSNNKISEIRVKGIDYEIKDKKQSGVNIITSLTSIPNTKEQVIANLSGPTEFSLSAMEPGDSIEVTCIPSANFAQEINISDIIKLFDGKINAIANSPFNIKIDCYKDSGIILDVEGTQTGFIKIYFNVSPSDAVIYYSINDKSQLYDNKISNGDFIECNSGDILYYNIARSSYENIREQIEITDNLTINESMVQYEPGSLLMAPFRTKIKLNSGVIATYPGDPINKGLKIKYDFNSNQGYLNESTNTYGGYYSINNIDPKYSASTIYYLIETEYFNNIENTAKDIISAPVIPQPGMNDLSEYNSIAFFNNKKENVSIVSVISTEYDFTIYYSINNQNYNEGYVTAGKAAGPGIIPLYKGQNLYYKYNNGESDVYGELLNVQGDYPVINL